MQKNTRLYLRCLEFASRPRKGIEYNYEGLLSMANDLFLDKTPMKDKIAKLLAMFENSSNSISAFPKIDGKTLELTPEQLNHPIEKTPSPEYTIELADKYYAACIAEYNNTPS